uniref:E3 UFM1-protein ligase 1 homolog n=1 Tax=Bursaphelenchus xylophilus TaxID=6326 RepID=A0A1I7S3A1_BURXY
MATWADIRRLAADLQRVQAADSEKKLSEANCIEVITKLINSGAIDIVVASNGKEYITKKHLITEIENECIANGGRVTVTDLVALLNVNLEHVETATSVLINSSHEYILCAGELLARDFINGLCKQLNEKLKETGQLSMLELSKTWDLPTDVFNHYVLPELGTKIDAKKVEDQLYTNSFLQIQTNKLRACLAAFSKPTSLSSIFSAFSIPESLFFNIWNGLIADGKLSGHVVGAKNNLKAYYVPRMHEILVKSFIKKTFESEGFIATSLLKKLSVNDAKAYFKDLFSKKVLESSLFLESGVVTQSLWADTITSVHEELTAKLYVIVEEILPTVLSDMSEKDIDLLYADIKRNKPNVKSIIGEVYVLYDDKIVDQALEKVIPTVIEKARSDAPSIIDKIKEFKLSQQNVQKKAEEDDDWGSGGGKKKGKSGKKQSTTKAKNTSNNSQDYWSLVTLDKRELREDLSAIAHVPDLLLDEIIDELFVQTNNRYKEEVELALTSVDSSASKDMKKLIEERRLKAQHLYDQLLVFEQSLDELPETLALDLKSYLTKSICLEICQLMLSTVTECPSSTPLSNKVRDELINSIKDPEAREILSALFASTSDLAQFHDSVTDLQKISIMLRIPDKKKRTETFESYKELLRKRISEETDPPTLLLTCILFVFATKRGIAITCTGKFVGQLIKELSADSGKIPNTLVDQLQETQKLVVDSLKKKNVDQELMDKLTQKAAELKTSMLAL